MEPSPKAEFAVASLLGGSLAALAAQLDDTPEASPSTARQPVHVIYGGAHLYRAGSAAKLGALARAVLDEYAPDDVSFADAMGLAGEGSEPAPRRADAAAVRARVVAKLAREPVEDQRIDFEDGYGPRPDAEEDEHAVAAGRAVAQGVRAGSVPAFLGVRVKALAGPTRGRSLRTLDRFFSALRQAGEAPPADFVVTLPKVTQARQVATLAEALDAIERAAGWSAGQIGLELMIETPLAIVDADGRIAPRRLVDAARGRCRAVHFGTYDYTAACDITAAHQRPDHGACDLARRLLQVSLAGTGVRLSDGATTTLPIPPHRAAAGAVLSDAQRADNHAAVHTAWRLHRGHVSRALADGFYQGWDLHPAQLPARYAAVYAFFLAGSRESGRRLRNFLTQAAQATQVGGVFDDAATGLGLLTYFRRALACGALTADELTAATGLPVEALGARSFAELLGHGALGGARQPG